MDKVFAQTLILLVMLGLASGASLVYLQYAKSNSPQSQVELKLYAQTAASLFYSDISQLTSNKSNLSYLWFDEPKTTLAGWVCRDILAVKGTQAAPCGDMVATNTSVKRNFVTSFWDYYAVMVYIPPSSPPINLTFNWWLNSPDMPGWIWYGAFVIKGDATSVGNIPFDVVESAPFYWSYKYFGGYRSGTFSGLTVSGGYTLAVLVNELPSIPNRISYGFTLQANPPDAVTVILPSDAYSATVASPTKDFAAEGGPVAVFNLYQKTNAQLSIYFDDTLVAQIDTTLTPGEQVVFYPGLSYPQPPNITLLLNYPVEIYVSSQELTLTYGGVKATVDLPNTTLLGGGVASAWTITLAGCQKTCVVAILPAQNQPAI